MASVNIINIIDNHFSDIRREIESDMDALSDKSERNCIRSPAFATDLG